LRNGGFHFLIGETKDFYMSKPHKPGASHAGNVFRFTLTGLIVFSLTLMAGSAFIAWKLTVVSRPRPEDSFAVDSKDKTSSIHVGPWGELLLRDISLERPEKWLRPNRRYGHSTVSSPKE
jgi:hypothetical protein